MTLKTNEIKRLYQEYIKDQRPASRESCPSFEDLLRLLSKAGRRKRKTVKHLTCCSYCLEEIAPILKISRANDRLLAELSQFLRIDAAGRNKSTRRVPILQLMKSAAYALVTMLIIGTAIILYRSDFTNKDRNRGQIVGEIQLIAPYNQSVSRAAIKLEWKGIDKYDYCFYELFDESMRSLWKSPKMIASSIMLPPEISGELNNKKLYYWMVTVFLNEDQFIESPLARFILSD